uniref:ATP synthase F0 subunit 6 n=1 Tax=Virpazaria ripkeni TaxID=2939667 RepID=UPI0020284392|nr:ATP synthase F0 subunit 6 [Virpazaria ripkeni]UPV69728.1 ATP synthase F0 subunit 6 [Virpazaria ripkeni]UPV69741.1 ATP synthase F0 subunit 6 [Virpazaria ripkeni]
MFSDLFSSMDGNISLYMSCPPLVVAMVFLTSMTFNSYFFTSMKNVISTLWAKENMFLSKNYLTLLMLFIMVNNFIGLIPLTYSSTTSLWVNSSMAMTLWLTILMSGWSYSLKKSLAHLAPTGAPAVLVPFLVVIESISILIRPITLTVRLVANISAGHIILSLISNVLSASLPLLSLMLSFFIMVFYSLFEMFVSFIQAYIFTLLVSLYMSEHP